MAHEIKYVEASACTKWNFPTKSDTKVKDLNKKKENKNDKNNKNKQSN